MVKTSTKTHFVRLATYRSDGWRRKTEKYEIIRKKVTETFTEW